MVERTVEDDPGAPFFNDTTKYVVSGTHDRGRGGTRRSSGPTTPTRFVISRRRSGDLYVSGSGTLVKTMLADGLIDGLHLFVYPLTRGSGPRLFPDTAGAASFRSPRVSSMRTAWFTWPRRSAGFAPRRPARAGRRESDRDRAPA